MRVIEKIIDQQYSPVNPVQFGYEDCTPRQRLGPAVRTHWIFHYVTSGCGEFTTCHQTRKVKSGDMFVIAPYEQAYYEADSKEPWNYIWVGFEATNLPLHLEPGVIHSPGAGKVFNSMLECSTMANGKSAFLVSKIWNLFALLIDESEQNPAGYVEKAINQMQTEYMFPLKISQLAEQLHIDRSYFCNVFREQTGKSPQQYLMMIRMQKAADLMVSHKESPITVAASVGYSDIYGFSRMFKKTFGLSPRAYIAKNREKDFSAGNIEQQEIIDNEGN